MIARMRWTLAVLALVVASGLAATAAYPQAMPRDCSPGTPSALRFSGLPARIAFGTDEQFSTDYDDPDWDVAGRVTYTMADTRTGRVFYRGTGHEFDDLFVELDLRDAPARIAAEFTQSTDTFDPSTGDETTVSCRQTIASRVRGYRHFRIGDCDRLRYRPRHVVIACGDGTFQLRRLHWRTWNRPIAHGSGRAMLNDCIPYCARGRFHFIPATVTAYRLRVCRRGNGAEGYHYTRLRIRYRRPLSRRSFPYAGRRARHGYVARTRCFSYY